MPYNDEVMARVSSGGMSGGSSAILLGRRTYEIFASIWPHQPEDNPFTTVMNESQKYVASRTFREPLEWRNSTLVEGDAGEAVARLKQELDRDVVILGSGGLIRSLLQAGVVDELVLLIHPLVLASGRRLFPEGGVDASFELADTKTTTTGVIIATYRPAARQAASE